MRNTIHHPIEAAKLPAELLRDMPGVKTTEFLRITYEVVDENGFSEEQVAELDQALMESRDPANLIGPFNSAEEMIAHLHACCGETRNA